MEDRKQMLVAIIGLLVILAGFVFCGTQDYEDYAITQGVETRL